MGLVSPLKLLKHQPNRHHCGRLHYWSTRRVQLDESNHLLLLFSDLSDFPLGLLCKEGGCEFAKCSSARKCVQVYFVVFFSINACLKVVALKQDHFYRGACGCQAPSDQYRGTLR